MIISVEELKSLLPELASQSDTLLQQKLNAMELMVRKYTNNNFQNRNVRFLADSNGEVLNGVSPFLQVGDTVQVSESGVNDGLYVVTAVDESTTTVEGELFTIDDNLVTKVEYPDDIKMGIINLMKWEFNNRDKVGIKSETISRHSVTYADLDTNNQVMGFPVSMLGFLTPYKKARF